MKKIALYLFMGVVALLYGCNGLDSDGNGPVNSNDDDTKDSDFDIVADNGTVTYNKDGEATTDKFFQFEKNGKVKVRLKLKSSKNILRVYTTRNPFGTGVKLYKFEDAELSNKALRKTLKNDGSIDLPNGTKTFDLTITLPILIGDETAQENSEIVYHIWGTSGKGNFRDTTNETKRLSPDTQVATITLRKGTPPAPTATLKTFTAKLLSVPTEDRKSKTFMSTYDGTVYDFTDSELAALWDVGYYYGNTDNASLASAKDYPELGKIKINELTGLGDEDLNAFYMIKDNSFDYNKVTTSILDGLTVPETTQKLTGLSVNDIIKFKDAYGKKGVIKVVEISGTFNKDDYIKLDFKMQP